MNNWKFFKDINFADERINQYHIDTRDFHCATSEEKIKYTIENNFSLPEIIIHKKLIKNGIKNYYHTPKEAMETLTRLFEESHGENEWRMLSLEGEPDTCGWQLKYIRIYRTEYGLIICNSRNKILNKTKLNCRVNQEYLHAHTIKK